ncbi:hypothetical protein GUJ93_ZPchr0011g27168 [Zizania palustris]|uniref:C2H2-type domain-containing protein n=1 Tax=Zizania palustris TaxID=103762 RepID=A0A8J5WFY3_ZIZPA|nr:hypothetical protein GUJ93_ZPchr0011g27168 [Zizania palustris]
MNSTAALMEEEQRGKYWGVWESAAERRRRIPYPWMMATADCSGSSEPSSWEEQAFAHDAAANLGGCVWPPRFYSCSFCQREFRSAQALGGHMNVHRRDRALLRQGSSSSSYPAAHEEADQPRHYSFSRPNPTSSNNSSISNIGDVRACASGGRSSSDMVRESKKRFLEQQLDPDHAKRKRRVDELPLCISEGPAGAAAAGDYHQHDSKKWFFI